MPESNAPTTGPAPAHGPTGRNDRVATPRVNGAGHGGAEERRGRTMERKDVGQEAGMQREATPAKNKDVHA